MKTIILILLLLLASKVESQSKIINLTGKILEFHSCPISSNKYKDFECAALNYNISDSFWDFVDMVRDSVSIHIINKFSILRDKSYATFRYKELGDTLFMTWPYSVLPKRFPSYLVKPKDTLFWSAPSIMHLNPNSNFRFSTFLLKKDSSIHLAGYVFKCYIFKQYLRDIDRPSGIGCTFPLLSTNNMNGIVSDDLPADNSKFDWQLIFIDQKTLLPLQIITLSQDCRKQIDKVFYLYSIK